MIRERFIIDLQGSGYIFRQHLANLGVSLDYMMGATECPTTYLDFVYNECTSQILQALSGDPSHFLERLKNLPAILYLENVPMFKDPVIYQKLQQYVQEFGFHLLILIQNAIGLPGAADYLLDTLGQNLIIVARITY